MLSNQRGMAVAMVLLILAIVSLLGAGLMVQSRLDVKFNSAKRAYDKAFNMADGGVAVAYTDILLKEVAKFDQEPSPTEINPGHAALSDQSKWYSYKLLKGYSTDPADMAGWEAGPGAGYHVEFWIGNGISQRLSSQKTERVEQTVSGTAVVTQERNTFELGVDIAISKISRN
jgi:hypothetical protein